MIGPDLHHNFGRLLLRPASRTAITCVAATPIAAICDAHQGCGASFPPHCRLHTVQHDESPGWP
jgi:hypothetical protein